MNNAQKNQILNFINNIANNDLKNANSVLQNIVNEKIKQRIVAADKKINSQK